MKRLPIILKVAVTIVSAVIISYSISFLSERVNILEKFTIAITDIDFSDLYYHYREKPKADDNIVLINIGYLDRTALAGLIKTISDNNPKVMGGDVLFSSRFDSVDLKGTEILNHELRAIKNLVMVDSYEENDRGELISDQSPLIRQYAKTGIARFNIAADDKEYGTVRSFEPIVSINATRHLSFGFLVGSAWDSTLLQNAYEGDMMIKWYGRGDVFKTFDWRQIQSGEFNKMDLENKIVLLGFLGAEAGACSVGDQFYSPLNEKAIGRSLPDMYGLEIHANIIKMIIEKDFIYHSKTGDLIFNLTFAVLLTMTLFWIQGKYEKQYSLLSKITLILFIDLLVIGTIGIFLGTKGGVKFLIGDGLFVMLFLPDVFEFLETNVFKRFR